MRSYRNASSSASLTSAGTWALIVTAICACCAAVATSRRPWERTAGYRDMYDPRYGRRRRSSSARAPLAWPTSYGPGSDTTFSSGSETSMSQLETHEGVYSWDFTRRDIPPRKRLRGANTDGGIVRGEDAEEVVSTNLLDDIGGVDNTMVDKPLDLSVMTLDWVNATEDPIFQDLSRSDRRFLYISFRIRRSSNG